MASVFTTTRTSTSIQLAETRLNTQDELGLAGLFQEQVSSCSLVTAIEDDAYSLSYVDLHSKAARLAEQVDALAELNQNPVGILIPRGINHVLAQLAILFSGRACVPLDDKLSDDCLRDMLGNLGSTFVTTDSENAHRLTGFTHLLVEHTTVEKARPPQLGSAVPKFNSPIRCSHIFHTSGTTGKPKAVELLAGGLINLCRDPDAGFIKPGQRVGHAASVVFDISLVEIWGSLLNGATIVVIPLQCVLDPLELSRFIKDKGLDVVQLTTALLDITAYACSWAFSSLDTLITGGEAMNCQSVRSIFEAGAPHRIINAYGPTECSVYCTWHCVLRSEAEKGCIPVGKPIRNVEAFLVDEHFEPVGQGKAGELLVAGAGLAGGYIGEKEKTAKSFICLPRQCRPGGQTVAPTRVYRTGDLMRRDETGHYCYIGRIDNQVKIGGKRVELETIESILQETGLVSAATVIKVSPREAGRGSFLVAFCIPTSADITAGMIATSYIDLNPRLLVPRIELTDLLPLKNNGKVDRARLERQYTEGIESSLMRIIPSGKQEDHIRAQLGYIWVDVLGLPGKDVLPTDDFIAMGGSSLTVATLIARINHAFGISLRASMLYERMTLDSLAELLAALQLGDTASPSVQVDEEEVWLKDSALGHDLRPLHDDSVLDWETASEGRVFMTGATGFVGAFLLAGLLEQQSVKKVACLVRAQSEAHARKRLEGIFRKYQLHLPNIDKLIAVPGSFGQNRLGLSDQQYNYYAEWASVIFHLGAKVNYLASYSAHRADNVLGTINILKFATHKRIKPTHYTSTIAAYGPTGLVTGTKFLHEDARPAPHIAALHYDTGYAQSQLVAETIVWTAIDNGLPIAIYRPGFVLGHSKTGLCNPDDFISRLFASCMELGCYPILPRQRKEFVPVDFVASALLHISRSRDNLGYAFNLVHPIRESAIDMCDSFVLLDRLGRCEMRAVPYAEFVQSLSLRPEDPLYPLVPMLREKVLGERTRWEVYENMVEYGRDNLHRALQGSDVIGNCGYMEELFDRCLKSWLPGACRK